MKIKTKASSVESLVVVFIGTIIAGIALGVGFTIGQKVVNKYGK